MNAHSNRKLMFAALPLVIAALANPAPAQLVDPGFENNPLETAHNVLNFFEQYQGFWGPETGDITGQVGPVAPLEGTKMLRLYPNGGVTTQVFQVTDVSADAALIDSGNATVTLSSFLNADPGISAAVGAVVTQFYAVPDWYSASTYIANSGVLDADPGTWQEVSVSGSVPVGTRWIVSQVYFSNAPLGGLPAFVDAAEMTITSTGYACSVAGACPGTVTVSWSGTRPNEQQAAIYSSGLGSAPIGGVCGIIPSGLATVTVYFPTFGTLGGSGSHNVNVSVAACGKYIQLVTYTGGPCITSNVAQLP